jgi:hypothetical protein
MGLTREKPEDFEDTIRNCFEFLQEPRKMPPMQHLPKLIFSVQLSYQGFTAPKKMLRD